MLTVGAQVRRDPPNAGAVQQTDGRITQQCHDRWSLAAADLAGILSQRDIFAPMEPILNRPVVPAERQETGWRPGGGRQAGDPVAHRAFRGTVLGPGAL